MLSVHGTLALVLSCILCVPLFANAAEPVPRAKPEEAGMSSERLALIGKIIDSEIARDQLPGGVLAIARRGKLIHFAAYGYLDKAAGTPMRTDAIFNIASMTKPMVAVAGLQLYEQGRLLMNDPLEKYFQKFEDIKVAVMDAKKEKHRRPRSDHPQDHDSRSVPPHVEPCLWRPRRDRGAQALSGRQHASRRRNDRR